MHLCATLKTPASHSGDFVPMHLALDVHGVQLSVVVLGDDLHDILLLEGILIRSLHRTHTLDGDGGAHLQRTQAAKKKKKTERQLTRVCVVAHGRFKLSASAEKNKVTFNHGAGSFLGAH